MVKEHQSRLSRDIVTFKIAITIRIQEKILKKEDNNVLYQVFLDLFAKVL